MLNKKLLPYYTIEKLVNIITNKEVNLALFFFTGGEVAAKSNQGLWKFDRR